MSDADTSFDPRNHIGRKVSTEFRGQIDRQWQRWFRFNQWHSAQRFALTQEAAGGESVCFDT